jgi:hypothetical protein
MKFGFGGFFENLSKQYNFLSDTKRIMSVRPHGITLLSLEAFSWNLMDFSKICPDNTSFREV